MTEIIRPAQPGDEAELTAMIHELAEFERAGDQCTVTENQLRAALFGDQPTVTAHVAEVDGQAAAGALWFRNFSTWDGVPGIYLEDLFVRPQFRRRGLARAMLATLARECVDDGYTRLSWAVLDWNVNAIALYDAVGGQPAERVDHLSGVGPGVVGARPRILSASHSHRRRAEQQHQRRSARPGATGIAESHWCEPTAMYQATGSSSSWANTAMPRPQRRPVHSAHPAASTAAADDREPGRSAETVEPG